MPCSEDHFHTCSFLTSTKANCFWPLSATIDAGLLNDKRIQRCQPFKVYLHLPRAVLHPVGHGDEQLVLRQPLVGLDQTHVSVHVELEEKKGDWFKEKERRALFAPKSPSLRYLFATVVEDEDDGSGEEDGHEADAQAEDPVVGDGDVEVQRGEDGAPNHHVEHLLVGEESHLFSRCDLLSGRKGVMQNTSLTKCCDIYSVLCIYSRINPDGFIYFQDETP